MLEALRDVLDEDAEPFTAKLWQILVRGGAGAGTSACGARSGWPWGGVCAAAAGWQRGRDVPMAALFTKRCLNERRSGCKHSADLRAAEAGARRRRTVTEWRVTAD